MNSSARPDPTQVFLSFGGNQGDVLDAFSQALHELRTHPNVRLGRTSRLYLTEPWGDKDQSHFYNQVVELLWSGGFKELTRLLEQIEENQGRDRNEDRPWGPRTLDIDILLYGQELINRDEYIVPHKHLAERRFALAPLAELEPSLVPPGWTRTVREALEVCEDQGAVKPLA